MSQTQLDTERREVIFNSPRSRKWIFTLNNWTNDEYEKILNTKTQYFCIGKEVSKSGTPHLQGYLEFKNAREFKTMKNLNERACWFIAKGTREENLRYCSKEGDFVTNIEYEEEIEIISELLPWQKSLVDIIHTKPDKRKIYWYWDVKGNTGKSALAKYLAVKHNALVVAGTAADVKYTVAMCKKYPKIIIWDLDRACSSHLSYGGLEQIKNGLFCSTKYESTMVIGNHPHVIIFANCPPMREKLSEDRWVIRRLDEAEEDSP